MNYKAITCLEKVLLKIVEREDLSYLSCSSRLVSSFMLLLEFSCSWKLFVGFCRQRTKCRLIVVRYYWIYLICGNYLPVFIDDMSGLL